MKLVQTTHSSQGIPILSAHQMPLGDLLKFPRDTGIPGDSNGQKSWGTTVFWFILLLFGGGGGKGEFQFHSFFFSKPQ